VGLVVGLCFFPFTLRRIPVFLSPLLPPFAAAFLLSLFLTSALGCSVVFLAMLNKFSSGDIDEVLALTPVGCRVGVGVVGVGRGFDLNSGRRPFLFDNSLSKLLRSALALLRSALVNRWDFSTFVSSFLLILLLTSVGGEGLLSSLGGRPVTSSIIS